MEETIEFEVFNIDNSKEDTYNEENTSNIITLDESFAHGFTMITKDITNPSNKQKISLEAIGLYTVLCALGNTKWNLYKQGFKTCYNVSLEKQTKLFKELESAKYLRKVKPYIGSFKYYYYLFTKTEDCDFFDNIIEFCKQNNIVICPENIQKIFTKNPELDNTKLEALGLYITNNNKKYNNINNNIINNIIKNNIINNICVSNTSNNLNNNSKDNNTCINKQNKDLLVKNNMENNWPKSINKVKQTTNSTLEINTNLNISRKSPRKVHEKYNNSFTSLPTAEQKAELRRQKRQEALQQKIDNKNSIKTMDMQEFKHTMGELTSQDNEMAQLLSMVKELQAMGKSVNKTNIIKNKRKKVLDTYLDKTIQNTELKSILTAYVRMFMDTYHVISVDSFKLMLEDLVAKTNGNEQIMIQCVREATKKGWKDLYVSEENQKQVKQKEIELIVKQQEEEAKLNGDSDLALDENGNPLMF